MIARDRGQSQTLPFVTRAGAQEKEGADRDAHAHVLPQQRKSLAAGEQKPPGLGECGGEEVC